jgi:HK97 family phage major capsid protein
MPTMRELLARRAALTTEMRSIHDAHPDGTLPSEVETRWSALRGESDALQGAIDRQALLDDAERRQSGQPLNGGGHDANFDREVRQFSVVRALAGAANLPGVDAGREREISAEVARRSGRSFQGVAVPLAALAPERRVFTTGNPSGGPGSNIIATDLLAGQTIDHLRNKLVVRQLGATVLSGLTGNVAIPRIKVDATAAWVAENSAISATDPQTDQVSLNPKHVGSIVEFSRNLLLQSSPDVEQLVRGDLTAIIAQALDAAAIAGLGSSNQPTGILHTSSIGAPTITADVGNGGALAYDDVVALMAAVANANAEMGALAFVTNTKVRAALMKLKDSQNRPLGMDVVLQGQPAAFTNTVPSNLTKGSGSNLSAMIWGNWNDLLVGLWSEADLLVNPFESTAYSKGNVQVRCMTTMDVAVRHPESFAAYQAVIA